MLKLGVGRCAECEICERTLYFAEAGSSREEKSEGRQADDGAFACVGRVYLGSYCLLSPFGDGTYTDTSGMGGRCLLHLF
jgi:hypothetical protein